MWADKITLLTQATRQTIELVVVSRYIAVQIA